MPETPAQRAAREANLRKGNPAAYKRRGEPDDAAPAPAPAPEKRTFRARAPERAKPKARRVPPRAPEQDDPPPRKDPPAPKDEPPAKRGSSGGFFQGLAEGLGR